MKISPMRVENMKGWAEMAESLPPLTAAEAARIKSIGSGMKGDERAFISAIRAGVRPDDAQEAMGIPWKRAEFILLKWDGRGWWDYGVSLFSGWLTDHGHRAIAEIDRLGLTNAEIGEPKRSTA